MELKDTIELMTSEDFKDRFIAEYAQLAIRYKGLSKMIVAYENGTLKFTPKCSIEILKQQLREMDAYMVTLEERAEIEGIDLEKAMVKKLDNE